MTPVGTFAFQLNRDYTARVKALIVWRAYARRGGCLLLSAGKWKTPFGFPQHRLRETRRIRPDVIRRRGNGWSSA